MLIRGLYNWWWKRTSRLTSKIRIWKGVRDKRNCNLVSWKNIHSLPQKFIRHRKNSENLIVHLFFLLIVWFVTKPWRDKNNVKIEFRQIFLRLFQVLPRFISPYIIFRLIMKLLRRLLWTLYSKGLAGLCIWGTLWLYTTFFRGISH